MYTLNVHDCQTIYGGTCFSFTEALSFATVSSALAMGITTYVVRDSLQESFRAACGFSLTAALTGISLLIVWSTVREDPPLCNR